MPAFTGGVESYAAAMSRGHRRAKRMILELVNGTRYGCTVRQLAYLTYGVGREDAPTEAQLMAMHRTVRRLLAEGRVVERPMFGVDRYVLPATPPFPREMYRHSPSGPNRGERQTLQCLGCDVRWVSEEGAPHRLCWSCGEPGTPAKVRRRRIAGS